MPTLSKILPLGAGSGNYTRWENLIVLKFIHQLNEAVGKAVSWLAVALVIVVGYDVFTRYALNHSTVAAQELQWHLFSLLFLLATAYTLKHDKHVRVDVLYQNLPPKGRAWVNLSGTILFLLPFCILLISASLPYVANSFAVMETSPDPGGLPYRYLLKACIPLGYALLALQGAALAMESLLTLVGKSPDVAEPR